jgi:phenylalanyl-tRNA synthetase beta chain
MMLNGGSLETMTYPLIGAKLLSKADWALTNDELELVNSLSEDASRMRPSLIPHALNTVAVNNKNYESFSFFEIGRSYLPDPKNFSQERDQLIIGTFSKKESVFLETLNKAKKLLNFLNVPYDVSERNPKFKNAIIPDDWSGSHPHEYLNFRIMGKFSGAITTVHPMLLRNFKVKGNLTICVIDFTDFKNRELKSKTNYSPISKFPVSTFDCTVIADKDTLSADVLGALKTLKIKELTSKKIVDVFEMEDSTKAITIRTTFEDPNKTLDSSFIKESEGLIISCLAQKGFELKK